MNTFENFCNEECIYFYNINLELMYEHHWFLCHVCLQYCYYCQFQVFLALHKKWSFPLSISSVNGTKSGLHLLKNSLMENFIFCTVDNYFSIHVIHQGIQFQPLICFHHKYFHQSHSQQTYQFSLDLTILSTIG